MSEQTQTWLGEGGWAVCSLFCPSSPSSYFPHMMRSTVRSSHFAVDFIYKVDHSILLRVGEIGYILIRLIWYNSVLIHSPHNDTPLSLSPHRRFTISPTYIQNANLYWQDLFNEHINLTGFYIYLEYSIHSLICWY